MKILITGAAGYLGSSLLTFLINDKSIKITALDKFAKKNQSLLQCCYRNYLTIADREFSELDLARLKDFDVLIHLASIVGAKACDSDKDEAIRTNLELTEAIIKKRQKEQVFIFTNTNSGYQSDGVCDETSPLTPNSLYGKTKVEAEKTWLEGGGISLRFASLFGPSPKMRDDLLLNFLVKEAVFKKKIELFEGDYKRNFLCIFDAAAALSHIALHGKGGEAYNVGIEDENYTKMEVCRRIQKHLPETEITQKKVWEKDPDQRNYIVTNQKIIQTGWLPSYSVDEGIEMLVKYYDYKGE